MSNKLTKLEILKKIKHLKYFNYILISFNTKFLETNNQIIDYLNLKDLNPQYINLDSLPLDDFTLKKSLQIESRLFEKFVIQKIPLINEDFHNDYLKSAWYHQSKDVLDDYEKKLLDTQDFLEYIIETKNFYYKYQMFQCLIVNIDASYKIFDQISLNDQRLKEYDVELLDV